MNAVLWPAMREYVQAEAKLAAILERQSHGYIYKGDNAVVQELREQITRMETAVREGLESAI